MKYYPNTKIDSEQNYLEIFVFFSGIEVRGTFFTSANGRCIYIVQHFRTNFLSDVYLMNAEKKSFRNFKPIISGHVLESKMFLSISSIFCSETSPDSMSSKCRNKFFSIFKLSSGKKPVECDVSEVLEAKYGHSRSF